MQKVYRYEVVEAVVQLISADSSASNSGPTYATRQLRVPGIQSVNINVQREKQTLRGDGIILGTESSLDEIPVTLEIAQIDPDFHAMLFGMPAWATGDGYKIALTDESEPNYVGLWLRTNKVGVNGKDLVIYIPKFKADTEQQQQQQRAFGTLQISGAAVFTDSKFEVFEEGVQDYQKMAIQYNYRDTAASLYTSTDSTAPTITTTNITDHPVADNIVVEVSEALNKNTVNEYTVTLKTGGTIGSGTLVACTVSIDAAGDTITINPDSSLTGSATVYNVHVTTAVEDLNGNAFAASSGITVTTPA